MPNVIATTESCMHAKQIDADLFANGYLLYRKYRGDGLTGRGVAVLVNKSIPGVLH